MTIDPDTSLNSGLHTLCYRIDPDTLGDLVLYPLTAEFLTAWDSFARLVNTRPSHDEVSPSYSAAAIALTAATNLPVRLFPRKELSRDDTATGVVALLVTTGVIDPWIMTTALRKFEQLSTGDHHSDTLAPLLQGIKPHVRPVRDFLRTDRDTAVVRAPGWVFHAARWNLAARIAAAPMVIDDHMPITLRLDTEGSLIAFDHPLTRASKNYGRPRHRPRFHQDHHYAGCHRPLPATGRTRRPPPLYLEIRQERLDRPRRSRAADRQAPRPVALPPYRA